MQDIQRDRFRNFSKEEVYPATPAESMAVEAKQEAWYYFSKFRFRGEQFA